MFGSSLGVPELLLILLLVLVIFGPKQLPKLGKMFGKTMKEVRTGIDEATKEAQGAPEPTAEVAATPAPATEAAPAPAPASTPEAVEPVISESQPGNGPITRH